MENATISQDHLTQEGIIEYLQVLELTWVFSSCPLKLLLTGASFIFCLVSDSFLRLCPGSLVELR